MRARIRAIDWVRGLVMVLELGLAFCLLALFLAIDDDAPAGRMLATLALLGSTAFFYYLLHVHLIDAARWIFAIDRDHDGLAKTRVGAAITVLVVLWPRARYRRYEAAHPDGWTRYV